MPINIKDITIQNFQSFGNYETKLELDKMGPVLIVGELEESTQNKVKKSNGAGKSSLIRAIIWCLKGRTTERARPGDSIINYQIGKDCLVRLTTTDGYIIERTRKYEGKDELLFYKIGDKDTTLSTNTAAQKGIDKTFKVDYEILTSSLFLEQKSKPILELPPKQRQQILEKMLQLDKINYRADVAKEKLKEVTDTQSLTNKEFEVLQEELIRLENSLKETEDFKSKFEENRVNKIIALDQRILSLKKELEGIVLPDIDSLKKKWEIIEKLENKLIELKNKVNALKVDINIGERNIENSEKRLAEYRAKLDEEFNVDFDELEKSWDSYTKSLEEIDNSKTEIKDLEFNRKNFISKIADLMATINNWNTKAGTTCPACKQGISHTHTKDLIAPYEKELDQLNIESSLLEEKILKLGKQLKKKIESLSKPEISLEYVSNILDEKKRLWELVDKISKENLEEVIKVDKWKVSIDNINEAIEKIEKSFESKPEFSLREAEAIIKNRESIGKNISLLETDKDLVKAEENPYVLQMSKINISLDNLRKKIEDTSQKIKRLDVLIKHYTYIRKAYYDKNKIKSFILNSLIPILNDRFKYYLDQFGFDNLKLEFNNLLQVESDKWDIGMCSGGERQCIDLALMFALYDLNTIQYGRQCNIMILDEVDSKLDGHYVDALASVIIDDFGKESPTKPSTILTISHKDDMFDVFPTKIRVKKKDGFSRLEIER